MTITTIPRGNEAREAIDALKGYVYQIYQSALAWIELKPEEFLFLEVAEDFAVVAADALNAVQIKETAHSVTINSEDIIASIESFVELQLKNPELQVRLRHLTTSKIGKERSAKHRDGNTPALETWRRLAKTGDLQPIRNILEASKISQRTKSYICKFDDIQLREQFLKRIHFDCGALDSEYLILQLKNKLSTLLRERGGVYSQVDGCLNSILTTILSKVTQKERDQRFVDKSALEELLDKATQIPVNRAQFEVQSQLLTTLLAPAKQAANLLSKRLAEPKPINEVLLPKAIANRTIQINAIVSSMTQYGIGWVFGAAGVGKTTGAKMAAQYIGGNWVSINLRGLNEEQVAAVLSDVIDRLTEQSITGLLVDDLECQLESNINEKLLLLKSISDRTDLLILFTSPRSPSPDFLFSANLPATIGQKFAEFTEHDIQEVLTSLGVQNANWVKYIYAMSGGGHPQLAIAAIQSMQSTGWDTSELKTFNTLLGGNSVVEKVRAQTRERLLNELPEGGRRLLERLSLKSGGFKRGFVLDMAQVVPSVADGGIIFDRLIGSWIDQQERDRFALSPLLSNLAINTLTDEQKRKINFEIANSLIKEKSLNPIEANSVLLAALSGKNIPVMTRLCLAVIEADQHAREMIAPHLVLFTFMRTDIYAFEDDPVVSQMLRGAQLLLICCEEESRENIQQAIDSFETESDRVKHALQRNLMALMIYSKLLLTSSRCGALPNFGDLIRKLDVLLENQNKYLPLEQLEKSIPRELDGDSVVGFMFLNQAYQIREINELLITFEFLNSCKQEFRQKLLNFSKPEFEIDMLVAGAWLSEHKAGTIDSSVHSSVFARLEEFAKSWNQDNLAVCCRKFRAIIIDEYGNDKDQALAVLNEGLSIYGETNSELVRAKAKVLYRAADHQGSLELSKVLIEGNAPLSKTEKAFLGREAAISAENQGNFETARSYYLYGSNAAGNCSIPDMVPMKIGLMADAALASWHSGDREICLRDFVIILQELVNIDPKSSLRAAHCHALCRHVLLWLDQEATGKKHLHADGEETRIYPGVVSNPEPHSEIGKQYITPIEMAWYMLATLENNCCLDVGITQNLVAFLPKGPVLDGQLCLTPSKMKKAITLHDTALFITAMKETVAELIYFKEQGKNKNSLDYKNVTYGMFPVPTLEQQISTSDPTELFVLCFISNCIFAEEIDNLDYLVTSIEKNQDFKVRPEFIESLRGHGSETDYNTSVANLLAIHWCAIDKKETQLPPSQVFKLAFQAIQIASQTKTTSIVTKPIFEWLSKKWVFIWDCQRFLLKLPAFYEKSINQMLSTEGQASITKLIGLLQAILPTMGFINESELYNLLNNIRNQNSELS